MIALPCLALAFAISARRHEPTEPRLLGVVASDAGRLPSARVRFQGEAGATCTDGYGRFSLPLPASRRRVMAAKIGNFNGSAWSDRDPLRLWLTRLPEHDFDDYRWVDPTPDSARDMACGNCHGEIHREWLSSAHAGAATNPRLLNLYDGSTSASGPAAGWNLLREHPDGAGVCAACHAPTLEPDAAGDYDLRRAKNLNGLAGVHCDFCHKVAGPAGGDVGLSLGSYGLQLLRPEHGQLFFGPLDDVDRGEDAWSPFQRDSRFCASCHEGVVFGVPVYTTFSEWRESPAAKAGKQCQDCHMTPTGRMTNIAPGRGGIEREPKTLANHRFFDVSLQEMLRRCLIVDVVVANSSNGVQASVTVRADNVGHRVPTGFVDRNLVLVVEAFDASNKPLSPISGPRLPAVAGRSGAGRLYAKQLRDFDGNVPAPFWRADPNVIDTRLKPGEPDVSRYLFDRKTAHIRARLLYRRFWPEVAESKRWQGNETEVATSEWVKRDG